MPSISTCSFIIQSRITCKPYYFSYQTGTDILCSVMSMHACVSNIYIRRSIAIYFHHDWLQSLYHNMIYQVGTDIMVIGNGHSCIQYITYRIRTVAIYFNLYFHKLIYNNTQTIWFPIKLVQIYWYWDMCMHGWVSNIYIIRSIAIYCISLFYICYITKWSIKLVQT